MIRLRQRQHGNINCPSKRQSHCSRCFDMKFICLLLYLLPVWVLGNPSISQLRKIKEFPELSLTQNETLIVDLDLYYDGVKRNISVNSWLNNSVNYFYRLPVYYGSKTEANISDILSVVTVDEDLELKKNFTRDESPIDWTPFIILTVDQQLFSSSAAYILGSANFLIDANLSIPDDLICKDIVKLSLETLLLDCQLKDSNVNQGVWLFVLTKIDNGKILFAHTYREFNNITVKEEFLLKTYMNCKRTLKYFQQRLYRFCKASRHIEVSNYLEVFDVETDQSINWFTTLNTATLKSPFFFEDIESFNKNEIYVLDFCFGLYRFNFLGAIVFPLQLQPQLIGDVFYKIVFDGPRSRSLQDIYEEKRLIIASNRYVTELKIGNHSDDLTLYRRKNLDRNVGIIEGLFYSRNNILVIHRWEGRRVINGCTLTLKIFTRDEFTSNLVNTISFEQEVYIHFMKNKRELSFSPHEVTTLFAVRDKEVQTLEVGCTLFYFSCDSPVLEDKEITMNFSIQGIDGEWVNDSLMIYVGRFDNPDLRITDAAPHIIYNLLYPAFIVDLDKQIMGPNKRYEFSNAPNLSLYTEDIVSFSLSFLNVSMRSDSEINFLRGFTADGSYLFFKQTRDQALTVYVCKIPLIEERIKDFIKRKELNMNDSQTIECNEIHKENINTIENISSRGSEYVISFKGFSSLRSYTLENNKLIYMGDYLNKTSLECDRVLVQFSANYAICVTGNANVTSLYMFKIFKGVQNLTFYMLKSALTNKYQYFDHSLLSNGFLLAKTDDEIHIIRISFDENEDLSSAEVSGIIRNEITLTKNFEFAMTRASYPIDDPIQLFLISYDQNMIAEFEIKDITSPLFKRHYPLYNYRLYPANRRPFTNKFVLVVPASIPNDLGATYYLFFDSSRETKNVLRKVYTCKEGIDIFLLDDFSAGHNTLPVTDDPDAHVDFLQRDKVRSEWTFYRLQNQVLFGSMDDDGVTLTGYLDNGGKKGLVYESNFKDPTSYQVQFQVKNDISTKSLNLTLDLNVNFGDTILNFSSNLFERPYDYQNFSEINLASDRNFSINLPNFFDGPVETYFLNNNCTTHNLVVSTYAEFYNSYFVSLEASKNEFNIQDREISSQASFLFLDTLEAGRYIFLLSEERILVVDSQSKPKKFAVITSYSTGWICATDSPMSLFLHNDHNTFYLSCMDINERPKLFQFNFTNNSFPELPSEVRLPVEVTQIDNLIASEDLFFVILKSESNMNESNILILKRDGSFKRVVGENSIDTISTELIGTITPQSFNTDYLFIETIDVKLWGNIEDNLAYGTVFTFNGYIFYCEFLIEIDVDREAAIAKKPVVNIKNYNYINFQDILKLANKNSSDDQTENVLNLFWAKATMSGEMTLLITSPTEIYEIYTSRFTFTDFKLRTVFSEYYLCVNHFNRRPSFSQNFFAYPCLFNNNQVYIKIYKSRDQKQTFSEPEEEEIDPGQDVFYSRILQQIEVDSMQYLEVFVLCEQVEDRFEEKLVILANFGVFLEYNLSTNLTLTGTVKPLVDRRDKFLGKGSAHMEHDDDSDGNKNTTVNGDEFAYIGALNNFSNVSFRIKLKRNLWEPSKGMLLFYLLIVMPIITCVTIMFAICGFIKMYRRKRRDMLRENYLLNESTRI